MKNYQLVQKLLYFSVLPREKLGMFFELLPLPSEACDTRDTREGERERTRRLLARFIPGS